MDINKTRTTNTKSIKSNNRTPITTYNLNVNSINTRTNTNVSKINEFNPRDEANIRLGELDEVPVLHLFLYYLYIHKQKQLK